jgi:uncharacterized membrane protein YgaE (UPF0421/DUF939 family)
MKRIKAMFALLISVVIIFFTLFGSFPIATKIGVICIYAVCMLIILGSGLLNK